tara:strand:- start:34 stop:456 length:423 start_codon:yes stop_codon:yes gene_type:complete
MKNPVTIIARIGDKASTLGAVTATMGCAMCFPAIASLGAAFGMGFLSQWEWVFIETILPFFVTLALFANALGWFSHRQWHRSLLGVIGPILVLVSLYPLFPYAWSAYVTYLGLAIMIIVSIWDLLYPANKICDVSTGIKP